MMVKEYFFKNIQLGENYFLIEQNYFIQTVSVTSNGVFTMTVGGSSGPSQSSATRSKSTDPESPSARMKPGLAISKGTLYLYGGEYESGSKQYTLNDFYSLGKIWNKLFFP